MRYSDAVESLAPDLVDRVKEHCQDLISLAKQTEGSGALSVFKESFSLSRKR
ncbi:hypothetical protein SPFM12_00280 [Salmonella phage SPFM12]|nr:hypothetical protein SPFM12_00280 [Salmonella phage SPFM12]